MSSTNLTKPELDASKLKPGDTVIISQGNTGVEVVVSIETKNENDKTFTYTEFRKPDDLKIENHSYYGEDELIKTDIEGQGAFSDIVREAIVLRMNEYVQQKESMGGYVYVMRQFYDSAKNILMPSVPKKAGFCDKVPNPDDDIFVCKCARVHYYNLVDDSNSICDACGLDFNSDSEISNMINRKKRSPGPIESFVALKKLKTDFQIGGKSLAQNLKEISKGQKDLSQPLKRTTVEIHSDSISRVTSHSGLQRKKKFGDYIKKITQKVNKIVDKNKKIYHLSSQLPRHEQIRHRIRDNIFYSLVFGVEEIKLKTHLKDTSDFEEFKKEVKAFLKKSEKSQIDDTRSIALAIEANLYHRYNRDVTKSSQYSSRSRFIFMSLKHLNNFELRLKMILGYISPSQLCNMTEDELAPRKVKDQRNRQKREYLESKLVEHEITGLKKNDSGEYTVMVKGEAKENVDLPPVALESKNSLNVLNDVSNFEKDEEETKNSKINEDEQPALSEVVEA